MQLKPETRNETVIGDTTKTSWHDARVGKVYQVHSDTNDTGRNRLWCHIFCAELQRSI